MRIPVPCAKCSQGRSPNELQFIQGELDDSGVVYTECEQGHKAAIVYNARRYEVLLRSGGKALLAGFANESVSSFAAALERAYEFYLRVICRHYGIVADQLDTAWKEIKGQSERQLGAFGFLHLIETGTALPLNPEITKIRNRVIHQGRIAKESEASEFGSLVFQRIREIERALEAHAEAAKAEAAREVEQQQKAVPAGMDQGTLRTFSVLVKDGVAIGPTATFQEFLAALQGGVPKGMA